MRIKYVDIVKGILIIFVIIGHLNTNIKNEIYWFHMPAFFLLGGSLVRTESLNISIQSFLYKNLKILIIPYFSFFFLILVIKILMTEVGAPTIIKDVLRVFVGGKVLFGWWGPFWFINVLFLVRIFFYVFMKKIPPNRQLVIICIVYVLSSFYSAITYNYKIDFIVPFSADTMFICFVYYFFGFKFLRSDRFSFYKNIKTYSVVSIFLIGLIWVIVNVFNFPFVIDLKMNIYNTFLLNFLVPVAFFIVLIYFSRVIQRFDLFRLAFIGKHTLTIMYLHIPFIYILRRFEVTNFFILVSISLLMAILFSVLVDRNKILKLLFKGS